MYTHFEVDIEDWSETSTGNYSVWLERESPLSTVFEKNGYWGIVIDTDFGDRFVNEWFDDSDKAIKRATEILNGAKHDFVDRPAKPRSTPWRQHSKQKNGSPTYGRTYANGTSVSVQKASSGKWYYVIYQGANTKKPNGWFRSPEEACRVADISFGEYAATSHF